MNTHSRSLRAGVVGLGLGLVAGATSAQPAVLDHVPADNTAYVVMPDLGRFLRDLNGAMRPLRDAFGPQMAQAGAVVPLLQLFANSPGLDGDGSAAVVIELPEDGDLGALSEEEAATLVTVLLPVTDVGAFRESPLIQGQSERLADGVYRVDVQMAGTSVYMRELDGFAAFGADRASIEGWDVRGELADHRGMLGEVGATSALTSDALVVTPIGPFSDGFDEMLEQIEGQVAFAAAMAGGQQGQVDAGFAVVREVVETFARDAASGVIGVDIGAEGVSLDLLSNFKRGSELAGIFDTAPGTDDLIGSLPEGPFVVAYAQNNTDGLVAQLMENAAEMLPEASREEAQLNPTSSFTNNAAYSFMLAPSPAFGGAGLLSASVTYVRGDDKADAYRETLRETDGRTVAGVKYETSYSPDTIEINGVEVDGYSMNLDFQGAGPGGNSPLAQSPFADPSVIMSLLYGPSGGPSGYVASRGGGVYITGGKNSDLLAASFEAADGDARLTDNAALRDVMNRLPDGRNAEVYVNLNAILETVLSFAQMAGGAMDLPEIPDMPPLGAATAIMDGGVMIRLHVPMSVITTAGKLAEQFQGMGPGGPSGPAF